MAAALNFLAHKECGLPICNYFDDYTVIFPKAIATEGDELFRNLLGNMGWPIKASGDSPMQEVFRVLGVVIDLGQVMTQRAELVISNTPERVAEIKARIAEILREDAMSAAEASQLRGRLSFSNSQAFGREGAYAFLALGKRATGPGAKTGLSNSLTEALRWWADRFDSAKPRRVRMRRDQTPVFLFTDGSCEDEGGLYPEAAVGGVLYDPKDGYMKAFGGDLPTEVLAKLSPGGHKRQVVGQAELLPCWAARVICQP